MKQATAPIWGRKSEVLGIYIKLSEDSFSIHSAKDTVAIWHNSSCYAAPSNWILA